MRALLAAVPAVTAAACLGTPPPADTDSGMAPRCAPPTLPAGTAWPPAGIRVRDATIADVDGDGTGDLVVTAAPEVIGATDPGKVYILYGPLSATGPWRYHAELDVTTADLVPWVTTLEDVDGDGCLDLTVAGPPAVSGGTPHVAVWKHDHSRAAWTGVPPRRALGREPPEGPMFAVWADLGPDAARDLVVADLENVDLFPGSTVDAISPRIAVPAPQPCGDWGNLNALRAAPGSGGRERLVGFGHYRTDLISVDGTGTPQASSSCQDDTVLPITRGAYPIDLDGAAPIDLVAGGGGWVGAHLLAGAAAPVTSTMGAMACTETPRGSDFYIEGIAAGDLDGVNGPEVVLIDWDDGTSRSYACLLDAITAGPTEVTRNVATELELGAGVARAVTIGDAGGGTRAWVLDVDGALRCLRRGASPVLEACP